MKVALFMDVEARVRIKSAPPDVVYVPVPANDTLYDEFWVRRWFIETEPDVTVVLLPQLPSKTYEAFILQLRGYANVITAAMGFTKKLLVLGAGTSLCRVLGELCDHLSKNYGVNFVWAGRWYGDPVLAIEHVLETEKANPQSSEGAIQNREMLDEVVPEPGCHEQYGSAPEALLEVPVAPAEGAPSGDIRLECDSSAGEKAQGTVHDYAGAI